MTSLSATCFSVLIAGVLLPPLSSAGSVTGAIELKRADRRDVGIWLEPVDAADIPATPHHARMLQKDKRFLPHLLVVRSGATVDFPNADPIFHNAFSNFNGQIFDIGLYPPGKSRSVVFRSPGVVRVFCNIHPAMAAVILVVNTPFFATTDASGRFSIANVPTGEYRLHVFDERASAEALENAGRRVSVADAPLALSPIFLTEAEYVIAPHTNKFGKAYPPGSGEGSAYTIPQ